MGGESQIYTGGKPVLPDAKISQYLSNGSTIEAVGNYSSAPESFRITCIQGRRQLHIARLLVTIEDTGEFNTDLYGKDIVLTNGISVNVRDAGDNLLTTYTNDDPIHANVEWAEYCYDVQYHDFGTGSANKFLNVRWTFERSGKFLSLSSGDYLEVSLNDDFTGLVAHRFLVQGYYA